jgi:hypothetical protein
MKLLPQAPAELGDVNEAHADAIERAREHLNTPQRGRPVGVLNGQGKQPMILLKKLSLRHKQALSLTLQGMSREDAAEATQFTPEYITFLLRQPIARDYIAHINQVEETRLQALFGKSVNAMVKGLDHDDPDVALRAAKLQLQATGRLEPSDEGKKTAEDVVQAILLGVQVNVHQAPK